MLHSYVLLSGGIDSSTALTLAMREEGKVSCVSVDYGQRHSKEINSARRLAAFYGRPHRVLNLSSIVPKTMLTDKDSTIPEISYNDLPKGISPTYVPFRNGLMLSALASLVQGTLAESDEAVLYFGAHADDAARESYPDCSFSFTGSMAAAIYIGTYYRIRLNVPFQFMRKNEIIEIGNKLGTPYYLTWSCYAGGELHCGVCPTCRARKEAFTLANVADPTEYAV